MRIRAIVILIIAAVAAGFLATIDYRQFVADSSGPVLEPEVVKLVEQPLTNGSVNIDLVLRNPTGHAYTIRHVTSSCGCVSVVGRGLEKFSNPISLGPGDVLPWRAIVSTDGRVGQDIQLVSVDMVDEEGRPRELVSTIDLNVRLGWGADPRFLRFGDLEPGKTYHGSARIVNVDGPPGVEVAQVKSSDAKSLAARFDPAGGSNGTPAETPNRTGDLDLPPGAKVLGNLQATFICPPDAGFSPTRQEAITVYSKDGSLPPLRVVVVLSYKPPKWRFIPDHLLVQLSRTPQTIERTVRLVSSGENPGRPRVAGKPKFCEIGFGELHDGVQEIQLRISSAGLGAGQHVVHFTTDADPHAALSLPIQLLGPATEAASPARDANAPAAASSPKPQ
jgi:hypothetical protein